MILFIHRTDDGKVFRTLNILDEFSRECLAIRVNRKLNSVDVIDVLTDLFILRGVPAFIRSDNGPEFIAEGRQKWIKAVGAKTAYIVPGSPWENGYCESFNARFRDKLLNGESSTHSKRRKSSSNNACLSGYHPHPLYVVCTHFPEQSSVQVEAEISPAMPSRDSNGIVAAFRRHFSVVEILIIESDLAKRHVA